VQAARLCAACALLACADGASHDADADADTPEEAASGYANWPMPNVAGASLPNEQVFALDDEQATDTSTGLVWQRTASAEPRTFAEATADCARLELGGESDFRVPSRIEWVSLLDPSKSPALDVEAFPRTASQYHWTSSLRGEDSVYSVYLGSGETVIGSRESRAVHVRCVAGGLRFAGPRHELERDWVHDRATHLSWWHLPVAPASWAGAAQICQARGGRLPSLRELQTLVDESREDPAIDTRLFPRVSATRHWTETVRDAAERFPWSVDFRDGQTYADQLPSAENAALCVHSGSGPP
jgi:hypothetical protein